MNVKAARWGTLACALAGSLVLVLKGRDGSLLLETRDGGASWAARFEVQPVLNAMAFHDAGHAWFVGADGCVYRLGL